MFVIFGAMVGFVILNSGVGILQGARELACAMGNRLASAGLHFLLDMNALGC